MNAQHPAVFSHLFHLQHIANGQRDLVGAFSGVRRYATVPGVAKVACVRVSCVEYQCGVCHVEGVNVSGIIWSVNVVYEGCQCVSVACVKCRV